MDAEIREGLADTGHGETAGLGSFRQYPGWPEALAFMERARPDIAAAIGKCDTCARHLAASPHVLAACIAAGRVLGTEASLKAVREYLAGHHERLHRDPEGGDS